MENSTEKRPDHAERLLKPVFEQLKVLGHEWVPGKGMFFDFSLQGNRFKAAYANGRNTGERPYFYIDDQELTMKKGINHFIELYVDGLPLEEKNNYNWLEINHLFAQMCFRQYFEDQIYRVMKQMFDQFFTDQVLTFKIGQNKDGDTVTWGMLEFTMGEMRILAQLTYKDEVRQAKMIFYVVTGDQKRHIDSGTLFFARINQELKRKEHPLAEIKYLEAFLTEYKVLVSRYVAEKLNKNKAYRMKTTFSGKKTL